MADRLQAGMKTRRAVPVNTRADQAGAAGTEFDEPFQTFAPRHGGGMGSVRFRPHFTTRERPIITPALPAASGNVEGIATHTRVTANSGASRQDLIEWIGQWFDAMRGEEPEWQS